MIIAFDIDDTLANLVPEWLDQYNVDYKDHLTMQDMIDWDITLFVKPECGKKIYEYLDAKIYDLVRPLQDALWAVERAREIARVIFVTSCHPEHMGRKFKWLNDHGFQVSPEDYIECTDKSLVVADVLIDDRPANLDTFKGKYKFLIDKPWNQGSQHRRMHGFTDLAWSKVFEELSLDTISHAVVRGTTPEDLAVAAVKYDVGKPRMELLSPWVLMEVAKVMSHGAEKYSPHNWRRGFEWTRPIGASLRHISKWLMGEDLDPEWNLPHLAHAICCLMFTLEHQLLKMGVDDRWRKKND